VNLFKKWAENEYRITHRVVATILAGVVFVFIIPFFIVQSSSFIDNSLGVARFDYGLINRLIGGLIIFIGWSFAIWSILSQLTQGRGTPLPMMATQKLLTTGPFAYCRNPMSFGTIVLYIGLGTWIGSLAAIVIVIILSTLLISYIKSIEELELEERFGESYLEYKESTPLLIPKFRRGN